MAKMANWGELNARFGTSGSPANRCPDKSDIQSAGLGIAGSYADNQLVPLEAIREINSIQMRASVSQIGTSWYANIQATATEIVTSAVTITGKFRTTISGGETKEYDYSVTIPSGQRTYTRSTLVDNGVSAAILSVASVAPPYDDTYVYTASF